jgi:hypothetical protein
MERKASRGVNSDQTDDDGQRAARLRVKSQPPTMSRQCVRSEDEPGRASRRLWA